MQGERVRLECVTIREEERMCDRTGQINSILSHKPLLLVITQ
jgi:hypothetical protein